MDARRTIVALLLASRAAWPEPASAADPAANDLLYGPPAPTVVSWARRPMRIDSGVTEVVVGVVAVGTVMGTIVCAVECPSPWSTVVPVTVLGGVVLFAGYVVYVVGSVSLR